MVTLIYDYKKHLLVLNFFGEITTSDINCVETKFFNIKPLDKQVTILVNLLPNSSFLCKKFYGRAKQLIKKFELKVKHIFYVGFTDKNDTYLSLFLKSIRNNDFKKVVTELPLFYNLYPNLRVSNYELLNAC